jgi:hypothetical protein
MQPFVVCDALRSLAALLLYERVAVQPQAVELALQRGIGLAAGQRANLHPINDRAMEVAWNNIHWADSGRHQAPTLDLGIGLHREGAGLDIGLG